MCLYLEKEYNDGCSMMPDLDHYRIRNSFAHANCSPHIFFIGSAIEKKMAAEIWDQLENSKLINAANLNEEEQMVSISRWLCGL